MKGQSINTFPFILLTSRIYLSEETVNDYLVFVRTIIYIHKGSSWLSFIPVTKKHLSSQRSYPLYIFYNSRPILFHYIYVCIRDSVLVAKKPCALFDLEILVKGYYSNFNLQVQLVGVSMPFLMKHLCNSCSIAWIARSSYFCTVTVLFHSFYPFKFKYFF